MTVEGMATIGHRAVLAVMTVIAVLAVMTVAPGHLLGHASIADVGGTWRETVFKGQTLKI